MSNKPLSHQTNVVRLGEPRKHPNANSLELFDIGGYQCVTKIGAFRAGDLAVYIQPDSVVPQTEPFRFIWEQYANVIELGDGVKQDCPVPERRRRITCKRLRKEYSEGLLMPLSDFDELVDSTLTRHVVESDWPEGTDVSDLIGVTHYTGDQEVESTQADNGSNPKFRYPKTAKGWFFWALYKLGFKGARRNMNIEMTFHVPSFDVENFKNYKNAIKDGEIVFVTEKIHGSQARCTCKDSVMYIASRNYWKAPDSPCVWRKALAQNPWIEEWCRANEGSILYGEVVPTQKGYTYGCQPGEVKFFVFDIRGKDGNYLPKFTVLKLYSPDVLKTVPMLYEGPFGREVIAKLVDGVSAVDGKTQHEGVVVTVADPARWERGIGRIQLKWKSSAFLEKDGNR
jgi:hypothetical protein